jgi:hypothetical protein
MTTLNKTETNEVIERFMGILKYVDDVNLLEVVYELLKNPNHILDLDGFGRYLDKLMNSQNFKIKDIKNDDLLQFIKDDKIKSILIEIYKKHHSFGRGGSKKKRMSRKKKRMSRKKKRMSRTKKRMFGGDNDQCEICRLTWEETPNMSTCHHIIMNSLGQEIQHKYHSECLNAWYEQRRSCPLCNTGDITWINEARGDGVVCPGRQNQEQMRIHIPLPNRNNILRLIRRYLNNLRNIHMQDILIDLVFIALIILVYYDIIVADDVYDFIDFLYSKITNR